MFTGKRKGEIRHEEKDVSSSIGSDDGDVA